MNHCDKFFRFPIKLFLSKDVEDSKNREELLGMKLEEPEDIDYVTGWDCVDVGDIRGFGTIFSRGRSIADVKTDGFDSTIIYLSYGREVATSWSPEKFREKLNAFVLKLDEERKKADEQRIVDQAESISRQIEQNITNIVLELPEPAPRDSWFKRLRKWFKSL